MRLLPRSVPVFLLLLLVFAGQAALTPRAAAQSSLPAVVDLDHGWLLQDEAKVPEPGEHVSSAKYTPAGWYPAVVPGTVLTTLVKNGVYPDPLYGENNRPNIIPDTLARTPWWYRTTFTVPRSFAGRHIWLNFYGVNYVADVWVNGKQVGAVRGAFIRGNFDVSSLVQPGEPVTLAVLITPQPHPGTPHEHTIANGVGKNGGITALDGPTFLSTIGWDWLYAMRDRDSGIWQKVTLSASGPVLIKDPLVTTDLPLPRTDSSDVTVKTTVANVTDQPQHGTLKGSFGGITFSKEVTLEPNASQLVAFTPADTPVLHVDHPKLWWPNGYGPQNLYKLHLTFEQDGNVSDTHETSFGVRKISYTVPGTDNLTISVNGVPIFIRGGDWGLDEAMKVIPRERMEALIRLHQLANVNLIRNWVGQSTGEDFYDMCDKYGILLWDEFFQPNPSDGPNPDDLTTYMANVRDKILRFRNHPSIAVWCARNEGFPPKYIDDPLRVMLAELEPTRMYQPSSTEGHGVHSAGPYHWRTPREFYQVDAPFKTEIGSLSVPTLESIHGMMPPKDWETINDDWAQHDFAKGAQGGDTYEAMIDSRYGKVTNLADFVRKSQLANYDAFRSMYEGRQAQMFHPATAVITWMSNPAQPSFVWQLYHHDLEPNSALFAVKEAGEMVHIQLNESTGKVEVINNLPAALSGAKAKVTLYNLDGRIPYKHTYDVTAPGSAVTNLGEVGGTGLSAVSFVELELNDASGKELSHNFYWRADPAHPEKVDDLTALDQLAPITLDAKATRTTGADHTLQLTVTLHNPGKQVALMTHLQLRRATSAAPAATPEAEAQAEAATRVLPVYYSDNYLSLAPGESRTVTIEAAEADLHGAAPVVVVDGYNVTGATFSSPTVSIAPNVGAQPGHWPTTGLPMIAATAATN